MQVTVLADRGFADAKFYALLKQLDFEYVVRFRSDVLVTSEEGETRPATQWVPEGGRAKVLRGARVTAVGAQVGAVVCVKRKGMKESWCLATRFHESTAQEVMDVYARRFTIEESFRDVKELKFGMGLKQVCVKTPDRRDRLLLISALAQVLLRRPIECTAAFFRMSRSPPTASSSCGCSARCSRTLLPDLPAFSSSTTRSRNSGG